MDPNTATYREAVAIAGAVTRAGNGNVTTCPDDMHIALVAASEKYCEYDITSSGDPYYGKQ